MSQVGRLYMAFQDGSLCIRIPPTRGSKKKCIVCGSTVAVTYA